MKIEKFKILAGVAVFTTVTSIYSIGKVNASSRANIIGLSVDDKDVEYGSHKGREEIGDGKQKPDSVDTDTAKSTLHLDDYVDKYISINKCKNIFSLKNPKNKL
jgi:hypothetical protein